jgi:hypothetical protein
MIEEFNYRRLSSQLAMWCMIFSLLSCEESETGDSSAASAEGAGNVIPVTSDPGSATYYLIRWSTKSNGNREALTRREGRSGTSYARREIDCAARTFRYLGEGDTRAEAEADAPDPGNMGELVPGSISTEVADFVCRQ